MSVYELLEQVKDRDSFLIFLESERISAWIKDSDENFETIDFKKMAEIFYVGKIYE